MAFRRGFAHIVLACGGALSGAASAEVALIDSGTPNETSSQSIWYYPMGNYGASVALRFDLTEQIRVKRIELYWGGDADDVADVLFTDRLGEGATPANLLDTWTMHGTGLDQNLNQGQWETHSVDRVLDAGAYYVIVTPQNDDFNGGWMPRSAPNSYTWAAVFNSVRPAGNDFLPSYNFNPLIDTGGVLGFRVFVVPSPGAAGLVLAGGALAARRRARSGQQPVA